jgi:hypothetical protein
LEKKLIGEVYMRESNNRNTTSGSAKKRRLPIFSVSLIVCYLIVSGFFFVYGFGDGRLSADVPAGPKSVERIPLVVETPEIVYEPTVAEPIPLPPPVQVKGIWIGAWFIVEPGRLENFIDLCETTEINTLVIDVKDEYGHVTIPMESDIFPVNQNILLEDMGEIIADLKSRGIYTIARVPCFKDSRRSERANHLAHRNNDGNLWRDPRGYAWLNPYMRENWDYIAEICLEAARLGFDEIQLDYVRFPVEGIRNMVNPRGDDERTYAEIVAEFVAFIRDTMLEVGVRTSADVFGIIAISDRDAGLLGQELNLLYPALHYISPMIYPSHFANIRQNGTGQIINGILFETPDKEPYAVIYNTLQHFIRRMDTGSTEQAIIRPFLQDFTAGYLGEGMFIPYGPEEVRAQIQAVYDAGLHEWILWSNHSRYSEGAFRNP